MKILNVLPVNLRKIDTNNKIKKKKQEIFIEQPWIMKWIEKGRRRRRRVQMFPKSTYLVE